MRTNYIKGFYPRNIKEECDKPIYVNHSTKDNSILDLLEVNLNTYFPKTFKNNKYALVERSVFEEIDSGFATVNLSQYYLDAVLDGENLVTVKAVIADEMFSDKQYQMTIERTRRRNKVLSLDVDDGIVELASSIKTDNPVALVEFMELRCRLCCLINSLPEKQGNRFVMHFIEGKSRKEVAKLQGVSESSVNESINRGLREMRNIFHQVTNNLPCRFQKSCPD